MPNSIDKSKILSNLPSASRKKRRKRLVVDDDSLQQIRDETLEQTYPNIEDTSTDESITVESNDTTSSEEATTEKVAIDKATSKENEDSKKKKSAPKTAKKPIKRRVTKSQSNQTQKQVVDDKQSKSFTTFSCYENTVNNVRFLCSVLRENQYDFVGQAVNSYHEHLLKKGKLSSFTQGDKEKNDQPMDFLQIMVEDNKLAKMDALLLGIHKYQFCHDAIMFHVEQLTKKGLIPKPYLAIIKSN